jgi:hypothetical protein
MLKLMTLVKSPSSEGIDPINCIPAIHHMCQNEGRFTKTARRFATERGKYEKRGGGKRLIPTALQDVGWNDRQGSDRNGPKLIEVRFARSPYSVGIVPDIGLLSSSDRGMCHVRIRIDEIEGRE